MLHLPGLLIFHAVAEPQISSKSAKSHEISWKSLDILPNTCRHNIFESYLDCWGCLLENPGIPSIDRLNWGWECDSLFYRVLTLREECCVLWRITPYTFISPTKMTISFGTVRSTNDNACKMSKVHARSHEIANKPLRVHTTKPLWLPTWKTNYNAEKCASDVKKMKNCEVRQTTCNWIKKILDEATRIVNVFLISWFLFVFIMFNW